MGPASNFWFFIAIISIAGMYFDHKKSTAKLNAKMETIEEGAVQKEMDHINQRLAVLERIITDKNYDLNEQISELRSKE